MRGNASNGSVKGTLSQGKRDRDLESVRSMSERQILHVYLERKAEMAVRGESQLRDDYLRLNENLGTKKF